MYRSAFLVCTGVTWISHPIGTWKSSDLIRVHSTIFAFSRCIMTKLLRCTSCQLYFAIRSYTMHSSPRREYHMSNSSDNTYDDMCVVGLTWCPTVGTDDSGTFMLMTPSMKYYAYGCGLLTYTIAHHCMRLSNKHMRNKCVFFSSVKVPHG